MAKFIQINVHGTQAAQVLLYQTTKEHEAGILLISEQYRNPDNIGWHLDNRSNAAIHILPWANMQVNSIEEGNGYIRCMLDSTSVYSCYYSLNVSLETFQADLDDLEGSIRQWLDPSS